MFWEQFEKLCSKKGMKPNPVGKEIGISSGIITKWKNGYIPNGENLIKLAEYFNCSIDYLLGYTPKQTVSAHELSNDKDITQTSLKCDNIKNEYSDCYVACLDILNFKTFVNKNNFTNVRNIFKLFDLIKQSVRNTSQGSAFTIEEMSRLKFNSISDTIFISIEKNQPRSLELLIFAVNIIISNYLINFKLLVRGGIAGGNYFTDHEERYAFGKAIVDAHILEDEKAIYPRIIISPDVISEYYSSASDKEKGDLNYLIKEEEIVDDSFDTVNYFRYIFDRLAIDDEKTLVARKKFDEVLDYAKNQLKKQVKIGVLEKYLYFVKCYNNEIMQKSKYLSYIGDRILYPHELMDYDFNHTAVKYEDMSVKFYENLGNRKYRYRVIFVFPAPNGGLYFFTIYYT